MLATTLEDMPSNSTNAHEDSENLNDTNLEFNSLVAEAHNRSKSKQSDKKTKVSDWKLTSHNVMVCIIL